MDFLIFFTLGVIFNALIMPFLDSVLSWFLLYVEYKKSVLSEKINESTIKMKLAIASAEEEDIPPAHPIGFADPVEEFDEEEDEVDDL